MLLIRQREKKMKIGDIVITLDGRKATVVDLQLSMFGYYYYCLIKYEHELEDNKEQWVKEGTLEPVNCSIGKVYPRFAWHPELGFYVYRQKD